MSPIWLRPSVVLLAALFSTPIFAVPSSFIATPVISASELKLEIQITSQSAKDYCAAVTIRNIGSMSHQGWRVGFDLGSDTLKHLANAKYAISDTHVTVTPYSNQVNIEAGHKTQFEFCAKGKSGLSVFQQSVRLSHNPPVADLTTSFKVHNKDSKDNDDDDINGDNGKADYCVTVTVHNQGPDDVYDWRLVFDLGADKLVSMIQGRSDNNTGAITAMPVGGHAYIKKDHNRKIKFCGKRGSSSACATPVEAGPAVTILEPINASALSVDRILVSGVYDGPPNSGVTVNGVTAFTDGRYFYANYVPLLSGTNTLEAIVTTPLERTAKHSIKVRSTGNSGLQIHASPHAGAMVSSKVSFKLHYSGAAAIQSVGMDFDGDGIIDLSATNLNAAFEFTYNNPGVYIAQSIVTDVQGNTYRASHAIPVFDPQALNARFNAIFTNMNNALITGCTDLALTYLSIHSRDRYRPVFHILKDRFPAIISSYSPLQQSSITATYGEYAVNRNIQNVNSIFFIYFLQDEDGVWRIDSM